MQLIAQPVLQARAALGEGPLWDSQTGLLHWIDINNNRVHTFDPNNGRDSFIDVGEKVGCIAKRARSEPDGGGFIISLPERFCSLKGSAITTLARVEVGLGNRMNDGKCDPAGRFWCGSMHPDEKEGAGNLWMMDTDKQTSLMVSNCTISNGLAWSGDNRLLYYIDTPAGRVDVFDYDIASGAISNRREAFKNIWGGHFDGMTIDCDDNLFIAVWGGGCILKVDPSKGKLLEKIEVPGVLNVTCCTFGGKNMDELFITTSAAAADPAEEPNAGALFHISLPHTRGLLPYEFNG